MVRARLDNSHSAHLVLLAVFLAHKGFVHSSKLVSSEKWSHTFYGLPQAAPILFSFRPPVCNACLIDIQWSLY